MAICKGCEALHRFLAMINTNFPNRVSIGTIDRIFHQRVSLHACLSILISPVRVRTKGFIQNLQGWRCTEILPTQIEATRYMDVLHIPHFTSYTSSCLLCQADASADAFGSF
jgi:hypothetical protein